MFLYKFYPHCSVAIVFLYFRVVIDSSLSLTNQFTNTPVGCSLEPLSYMPTSQELPCRSWNQLPLCLALVPWRTFSCSSNFSFFFLLKCLPMIEPEVFYRKINQVIYVSAQISSIHCISPNYLNFHKLLLNTSLNLPIEYPSLTGFVLLSSLIFSCS